MRNTKVAHVFQSYQGSIFTDVVLDPFAGSNVFQSYQGSIFTCHEVMLSSYHYTLSILSRFDFYPVPCWKLHSPFHLSILSRFDFYATQLSMENAELETFNPIKVRFLLHDFD